MKYPLLSICQEMMMRRVFPVLALFVAAGLFVGPEAAAQQFVYQPKNPAFGGSYLNYQWMMSSAQAQNSYEEDSRSLYSRDPLQDFEQSLQRQILSQLSRELIYNRFGELDLTKEGRFDLGEFVVEIVPGLNELQVKIFNVSTGEESTVSIPSF